MAQAEQLMYSGQRGAPMQRLIYESAIYVSSSGKSTGGGDRERRSTGAQTSA
jgi:hypothetical protein